MDMDWEDAVLDWVNSLRLTESDVKCIKELGDGKFFSEILQILFLKTIDNSRTDDLFEELKDSLLTWYTPENWINYKDACLGQAEELVKIVSVIIALSSLQTEETIFIENPSNFLNINTQIRIRKFLESVLNNGNMVDSRFLSIQEDADAVPQTPHVYISSPAKDKCSPHKSPTKDFLSVSPELEADRSIDRLMSEKNDEISNLKRRIDVLSASQRDFVDEINSYKEENSKLLSIHDELKKETQSFKLMANLNSAFLASPFPETPESKALEENYKQKLKRSENYAESLQANIDECNVKTQKLEKELISLKNGLNKSAQRETELIKELEKYEEEKLRLHSEINNKDEIVKKLEQEIEDLKDCQLHQSNYENSPALNGFLELPQCDSLNTSVVSVTSQTNGFNDGEYEDMASTVIEVQLRETQEMLQQAEQTQVQLRKSQEMLQEADKTKSRLESSISILQMIVALLVFLLLAFLYMLPPGLLSLALEILIGPGETLFGVEKYAKLSHNCPPNI